MDLNTKVTKLLKSNPEFSKRRLRLLVAFFVRRILVGIQFGIILPTAWAYMKTFKAKPWFFGFLVSLNHLSGICVLPVAGILFDNFKVTKELILTFNFFEIMGNLIYALPYSPWLLVTGRLISGLGGGFQGVMNGEIAWITTKEERIAIFARLGLAYLLGMFCAPALAFSFKWVDFKIGNWRIQSTNAPGVLCCVLWFLYQICTVFMVRNLAKELSQGCYDSAERMGAEMVEEAEENDFLLQKEAHQNLDPQPRLTMEEHGSEKNTSLLSKIYIKSILKEMFAFEVLFIFFSSLLIWIFVGSTNVTITLFTQEDFHWHPMYTSIVYLALGVESFAVFGLISVYGRRLKDENLLMSGLCLYTMNLAVMLFYDWQRNHYPVAVTLFCTACFLGGMGLTKVQISTKSLLSKVFSRKYQGVIQSCTVIAIKVGSWVGPLIGGYIFTYVFAGMSIFFGLFTVSMIWGYFSIEGLKKRKILYK